MKKRLTLVLTLSALIGAFAEEKPLPLGDLTLKTGERLSGVEVLSVEPDGLRVLHRHGVGKLKREALPPEIWERFKAEEEEEAVQREQKRKEENEKAEAERQAAVRKVAEASKEQQQRELDRQRREVFAIVATGKYDFVAIDNALRENMSIWKAAGREDFAQVLEEDRQLIKTQQLNRPGEEHQRTVDALQARVQELERELREARNTPPPDPVTITETVYVERPVPMFNNVFVSPPAIIVKPPKPPIVKPPPPGSPVPQPPGRPRPQPPGGVKPPPGQVQPSPPRLTPAPPATVTPIVRPPQVPPAPSVTPRVPPINVTPTGGASRVQVQPGGNSGIANGGDGRSGAHLWRQR